MMEFSEFEMRILSELEEAGEEDAVAMLNTIVEIKGDQLEIAEFQQALRQLLGRHFVEIDMEFVSSGSRILPNEDAAREVESLREYYKFSEEDGHWVDVRESGPPYFHTPLPRLILTDAGKSKCVEILEARGGKWWRRPGGAE